MNVSGRVTLSPSLSLAFGAATKVIVTFPFFHFVRGTHRFRWFSSHSYSDIKEGFFLFDFSFFNLCFSREKFLYLYIIYINLSENYIKEFSWDDYEHTEKL